MKRQTHLLTHIGLAGLLLMSGGCASNSGYSRGEQAGLTGSINRQPQRDEDEEPARPVPPDPYKNVQYKGGRDPVTGVAPALDGSMPAPAPSPSARKAAALMAPSRAPATAAKGAGIRVETGDTLFGIARKHGVTVAALKQANGLQSETLVTGQMLVLPAR